MIILERELNGGSQQLHRFENNYGASVIRVGSYAYGGLELAVLKFYSEDKEGFDLCYDTPITDDVIGYLEEDQLSQLLVNIEALSKD